MSLIKSLDYENALTLLEKALKNDEKNTELLDLYAEVLINLDRPGDAKQVLFKSISIDPNHNGDKYMELAQLCEHKTAIELYLKGIQVYQNKLSVKPDDQGIKSSIASGYAAAAELYMTSDLCNAPNAEELVENYLTNAISYDDSNCDALIQFSNVRILRCRDQEAVGFMDKILAKIENLSLDNLLESIPSLDILLNLAKNYVELEIFDKAVKVCDVLVQGNDECLEYWYLLAFSHFKLNNNAFAMKCLKNLKKAKEKTKTSDKEIEDAAEELFVELEKLRNSNGELSNNPDFKEDEEVKDMNVD